jgi:hypothetical protein
MTTDLLTTGWQRENAEAEVPNLFHALAAMDLAHLVVRVVPDGHGTWGHEVPGHTVRRRLAPQ